MRKFALVFLGVLAIFASAQAGQAGRLSLSTRGEVLALRVPFAGEYFVLRRDGTLALESMSLDLNSNVSVQYETGNRVRSLRGQGNEASFFYDSQGRLNKLYLPGNQISLFYTTNDGVSDVYTSGGHLSVSYDSEGRVTRSNGSLTDFDVVQEQPQSAQAQTYPRQIQPIRSPAPAPAPTSIQAMHQQMTAMQQSQQDYVDSQRAYYDQKYDHSRISHSQSQTQGTADGRLVMPSARPPVEVAAAPPSTPFPLIGQTTTGQGLGSILVVPGPAFQVHASLSPGAELVRLRVSTAVAGGDWLAVGDSGQQSAGQGSIQLGLSDPMLVAGSRLRVQLLDSKGRIKSTVEGTIP